MSKYALLWKPLYVFLKVELTLKKYALEEASYHHFKCVVDL